MPLTESLLGRGGLVLRRRFPTRTRGAFLDYCRSFGRELLEWDFGPVMEMKEDPAAENYLFSREAVPFHWDGAFHRVPSYLVFYCVAAPGPGAGGETLFCDTRRVWADACDQDKAAWSKVELTYETRRLAHYGGRITGPLVRTHPGTGETVLRFAEPVETALNPVSLRVSGADEGFLDRMRGLVYSPEYCVRHVWEPGDLVIADNHALIHGRAAFRKDAPRHLRRIQLL